MALNDPLANVMSNILNSEIISKKFITISSSKLIKNVLTVMNDEGYIGSFEEIKSKKGNKVKINLLSRINKCGVIKPRLAIKKDDYEKFEKRFLPAKNFGVLLVSTTQGIITNEEGKEKGIGGKLIGYCY